MITPIQFTSAGLMFHYFDAFNIMSVRVRKVLFKNLHNVQY